MVAAGSLEEQQFRQLKPLLEHAWQTIPFYRDRLSGAGYQPGQAITEEFWTALPLLTRSDIQLEPDALLSSDIPKLTERSTAPPHRALPGGR